MDRALSVARAKKERIFRAAMLPFRVLLLVHNKIERGTVAFAFPPSLVGVAVGFDARAGVGDGA